MIITYKRSRRNQKPRAWVHLFFHYFLFFSFFLCVSISFVLLCEMYFGKMQWLHQLLLTESLGKIKRAWTTSSSFLFILFFRSSFFLSFSCVGVLKKIAWPKRGLKRSHEGRNFIFFFFHSHFSFSLYLMFFLSPLSPSFKVHEVMDLRGHELSQVLSSLPSLLFLSFFLNSP